MAELWENPMFRNKIQKLPPHLRERFVETMKEMYDQESDGMISFLGESRNEMLATADEIADEQEQLKIESETKARERLTSRDSSRDPERAFSPSDSVFAEAVDAYLDKRDNQRRPGTATSLMYESISQRGSPVPPPLKKDLSQEEEKPKKKRKNKENISQNVKDEKQLEAATQEIMANMTGYDSKMDSERDRQRERVEMMKQKIKDKKQARENVAQELLGIAQGIEATRKKDKEKQEQRIKERLEAKKKQKGESS